MNGVYFNEFDGFAASWLRNLFPESVVDERSIKDVGRADTAVYKRCHFFGGVGGWEYALQLAGWPEDRPVWTGSCPCQPFSSAGKQKGQEDERHLWPEMFRLIRECRPEVIFGEQVCSSQVVGKRGDGDKNLQSLQDRETVRRVLLELQRESPEVVHRVPEECEDAKEEEQVECIPVLPVVEGEEKGICSCECSEASLEKERNGIQSGFASHSGRDRRRGLSVDWNSIRSGIAKGVECAIPGQDRLQSRLHKGQCSSDSLLAECCGQHLGSEPCCADCECNQGTEGDDLESTFGQDWKKVAREDVGVWLDGVFADLESEGYTCGAVVLGAHSVGSPHIRQRLYWAAQSTSPRYQRARERPTTDGDREDSLSQREVSLDESTVDRTSLRLALPDGGRHDGRKDPSLHRRSSVAEQAETGGNHGRLAESDSTELQRVSSTGKQSVHEQGRGVVRVGDAALESCERDSGGLLETETGVCGAGKFDGSHAVGSEYAGSGMDSCRMGHSFQSRLEGHGRLAEESVSERRQGTNGHGTETGFWSDFRIIHCTDGKARRTGRGILTMVDGLPGSLGRIKPSLVRLLENEVLNHAKSSGCDAGEALRNLRDFYAAETVQWTPGRLVGIHSPEVLLAFLCQLTEQGWMFSDSLLCGVSKNGGRILRGVWIEDQTSRPSHKWGLGRQSQGEPADALQKLSSLLALSAFRAWSEAYNQDAKGVSPLTNTLPRGGSDKETSRLLRGARNNRVGRLKGYGNAIVPQVAAEFIRAFLESEAEMSP